MNNNNIMQNLNKFTTLLKDLLKLNKPASLEEVLCDKSYFQKNQCPNCYETTCYFYQPFEDRDFHVCNYCLLEVIEIGEDHYFV